MDEESSISLGLPSPYCAPHEVLPRCRTSRYSDRSRAIGFCMLNVLAAIVCALVVTNVADFTAFLEGKQEQRQFLNGDEEQRQLRSMSSEQDVFRRRLQTRCPFDEGWINAQWDTSLTREEREALEQLGWTKTLWNNYYGAMRLGVTTTLGPTTTETTLFGQTTTIAPYASHLPQSEQKCWQELNATEQDAARFLQYDATKWIECKKMGCSWPAGLPNASSTCLTKLKYLHTLYNFSRPWLNFTKRKRDNLVTLGWDPDGNAWAAGRYPFTYGNLWAELSPREITSARFLGYSSQTWDKCNGVIDSPCLDRLEYIESDQRTWIWEQLKPGVRERLVDLGWTAKTWFDGDQPAIMLAEWTGQNSITNQQRVSARILGWTQDTWSKCPVAGCVQRYNYINKRWSGLQWMQMKLSERRAWMLLGSTEALWASGNSPATAQLQWKELTPEQQLEAEFLGYNQGTWQGCNLEWGVNGTMVGNATNVTVDPFAAVRARMAIDRPYSEISGNIYGNAVAGMPVSFIRVFESAVARALFCGNPPLSLDASTYLAPDGEPLCVTKTNFEMQRKRVRVLNVVEGDVAAISVDFYFVRNATPAQPTSKFLFDALKRQLDAKFTSPLCHDKYFGRFCKVATMVETDLAIFTPDIAKPLLFESMRNFYDQTNYCLLQIDAKAGITTCASFAKGYHGTLWSQTFSGFLIALISTIMHV